MCIRDRCQVYIQTLMELAYNDPTDPTKGTRTISFTFDRLVVDQVTGEESVKTMTLNVPMIALVPMPAFTMDEATVDFNMEVKESSVSADTSSESISNTDTFKSVSYTHLDVYKRQVSSPVFSKNASFVNVVMSRNFGTSGQCRSRTE